MVQLIGPVGVGLIPVTVAVKTKVPPIEMLEAFGIGDRHRRSHFRDVRGVGA